METAVSAPDPKNCVLVAGDPTVFGPPFPLLPTSVVLTAGVGAHATSRPRTRSADLSCQGEPRTSIGPTCFPAPNWNYVRFLTCTCLVACGDRASTAVPSEPRKRSGPCLTLGLIRPRFRRFLLS